MYMLFVDESGTPPKPGAKGPRYFVVAGVIIPETGWHRVRDAIMGLKTRRKIRGEFKWRYFAPGNDDDRNPMRHMNSVERNAIRTELYRIICTTSSIKTMAAVCSAQAAYNMQSVNDQEAIYQLTYKVLTERFQYHLQDVAKITGRREYGIIVGDHRGAQDDKRLRLHHQKLLHSGAEFISNYDRLIESLFLQSSHLSVGIQMADLVAGAIWRNAERNDDRWFRFIEPSLRRGPPPGNKLDGFGIIKVPKQGWI